MRALVVLGLLTILSVQAGTAQATTDGGTNMGADRDGFAGEKREEHRENRDGDVPTNASNNLWFRPGWGEDGEGANCYTIEVDRAVTDEIGVGDADPDENSSWIDSDQFIDGMTEGGMANNINNLLDRLGLGHIQLPEERCPGSDPEDLVETVWRSELCPPPAPSPLHMAPENSALTGMPGYLEIGGDNPTVVPCLGEEILATARYRIDWGDGQTTETTTQGGPYPDGEVRHAYVDRGDLEIVVEAYWRGEWNGIDLGEVPNPTTDTLDIEVSELRSVRTTQN